MVTIKRRELSCLFVIGEREDVAQPRMALPEWIERLNDRNLWCEGVVAERADPFSACRALPSMIPADAVLIFILSTPTKAWDKDRIEEWGWGIDRLYHRVRNEDAWPLFVLTPSHGPPIKLAPRSDVVDATSIDSAQHKLLAEFVLGSPAFKALNPS